MTADTERELKKELQAEEFYVQRAGGSLGIDLVATRPTAITITINGVEWRAAETWLLEDKSSRTSPFYVKDKAQWRQCVQLARAGHRVAYSIRWTRGPLEGRREFFIVDGSREEPIPMRRGEGKSFRDVFGWRT